MATRSTPVSSAARSRTARAPWTEARRKGPAMPTRSAPSAIALATSITVRMPPLAKTGARPAARRARRRASAVEMPQPAKAAATRERTGSSIRCRSTSDQEVPPAPATSTAATPAASSSPTVSGARPQPTSFTTTGTSRRRHRSAIRSSRPAKQPSPSGCTASWSGFRCSTRASAPRRSTSRRQSSAVTPLLSWTAPRLAKSSTSGASGRTSKVSRTSGCSSRTRPEPSPMAKPASWATPARVRLMRRASSVPPVIDEIRSGASSRRPNSRVEVSTWSRSSSGSARCRKRYSSKPLSTPLPSTSPCRLMRMWSALRLTVATPDPTPGPSAPADRSTSPGSPTPSPDGAGRPSTRPVRDIVSELLELLGGLGPQPGAGHGLDRPGGEAAGGGRAQLPGPDRLKAVAEGLHGDAVGPGPEERPEAAPLGRGHGGVAHHHRVGDLPAVEVAVPRLPGQRRLAPDAQPVVADLEGEAQQPPRLPQPPHRGRTSTAHDRAQLQAGPQQRPGLGPGHAQVGGRRAVRPALQGEVETLALDHLQDRTGQGAGRPQTPGGMRPRRQQAREGHGVERVAGVDALRHPPDRPDGRAVVALPVTVLDVVVDEGEVVHPLQGGGGGQGRGHVAPGGLARPQAEAGAHQLPGGRAPGLAVGVHPPHVVRGHEPGARAHARRLPPEVTGHPIRVPNQGDRQLPRPGWSRGHHPPALTP